MPPKRPQKPATPKVELMRQVREALIDKYPHEPASAIDFLTNFFTSADLVGILAELKK